MEALFTLSTDGNKSNSAHRRKVFSSIVRIKRRMRGGERGDEHRSS